MLSMQGPSCFGSNLLYGITMLLPEGAGLAKYQWPCFSAWTLTFRPLAVSEGHPAPASTCPAPRWWFVSHCCPTFLLGSEFFEDKS